MESVQMLPERELRLESWLRRQLPEADGLKIGPFSAASSGTSSDTKLFSIHYRMPEARTERLVLRQIPPGRGLFPRYDLAAQAHIMRALRSTSIPVPTVRWFEPDAAVIGSPFIVMDFIDGEVPTDSPPGFHGRGLFFEASEGERAGLWRATIEQMAALHALRWQSLDLPPLIGATADVSASMAANIRLLEDWLDWSEAGPTPVVQKGLEWLKDTPPPASRLSLLWGDARPGNAIYKDGRVVAVLDWEMSTIGPAELDLSYMLWTAELTAEVNHMQRLAGLPDREATFAHYEKVSGRKIEGLEYAEMYTLVRLAIMTALGVRASVNNVYSIEYLNDNAAINNLRTLLG